MREDWAHEVNDAFWMADKNEAQTAQKVLERSEVPEEQRWDLSPLFADKQAWDSSYEDLEQKIAQFKQYEGTLNDGVEAFTKALLAHEEMERQLANLYVYAMQKRDEDGQNQENVAMMMRVGSLIAKFSEATSWFDPAFLEVDEQILQAALKTEELQNYGQHFHKLLRKKAHTLSPAEERLIGAASQLLSGSQETYATLTNVDFRYPTIKGEKGEEVELTPSRYGLYLESPNRELRKAAFQGLYSVYKQFQHTTAMTLSQSVMHDNLLARLRKFDSARAASLFNNAIPESVHEQLIEAVNKQLHHLHDYVELRKERLGVDELHFYDLYVPLVETVDRRYTLEEAKELIFKALAPLGEDYRKGLELAFSQRWIDAVPNRGKRQGAYSAGSYDSYPYILMSWEGTLDNVFTLIHELGHSMHSWYTRREQPFVYGSYSIFLAEIASTTNENLLTAYLLETEKDPAMQAYVLNHYLDGVKGTVFRQTQFAEFEHKIHLAEQNGEALTSEWLGQCYGEIHQRYYGSGLTFDSEISLEWSRIPHFYRAYYVYQYATGFSAATAFSQRILSGEASELEAYLGFLKAGCSAEPLDVLKAAGLDMASPAPVEATLQVFGTYLERFRQVLQDLSK